MRACIFAHTGKCSVWENGAGGAPYIGSVYTNQQTSPSTLGFGVPSKLQSHHQQSKRDTGAFTEPYLPPTEQHTYALYQWHSGHCFTCGFCSEFYLLGHLETGNLFCWSISLPKRKKEQKTFTVRVLYGKVSSIHPGQISGVSLTLKLATGINIPKMLVIS